MLGDADDPIRGSTSDEALFGRHDVADHFDADAGGDDRLYGRSGDDVYWLGSGTGDDVIYEGYHRQGAVGDAGDVIRLKDDGLTSANVRLGRDTNHLYVFLLDGDGNDTGSYRVSWHYYRNDWKVERVELADRTLVYDAVALAQVPLRGDLENDFIFGHTNVADHFDADAGGDDRLYGKDGDDVYWLGRGTGDDAIYEGHHRRGAGGDMGDVIRLKAGLTSANVRLERDTNHLYVRLLDGDGAFTGDSYQVAWHYHSDVWKVEKVELADGTQVYGAADFAQVLIRGGLGDDLLYGRTNTVDHFDADAGGADRLYGRDGDDVYWLGRGTGDDVIYEGHHREGAGDAGDVIRLKAGLTSANVRLERDMDHLYVLLLDGAGAVTDSYQVAWHYYGDDWKVERVERADGTLVYDAAALAQVSLRGSADDDALFSRSGDVDDHFDADAGGNDRLYGRGGDDVYWLGRGTGDDVIYEGHHRIGVDGDPADVIRLKAGLTSANVRLERDANHLYVRLLDGAGAVTDSYQVAWHYYSDVWKVERVELAAGTLVYGAEVLAQAPIRGGSGGEALFSRNGDFDDHFDADAGGNDRLYGRDGDDVYWLGRGTGNDVIYEGHHREGAGDAADVIRLKAGLTSDDVRLERDTNHLYVRLLDGDGSVTDSYQVAWHYYGDDWKVERVELADGTLVYDAAALGHAPIRGGSEDDALFSRSGDFDDHFDADAGGDDRLYGRDGDDVYWLGSGTDDDVIYEGHHREGAGDTGDVIEVRDYGIEDVLIERSGDDLLVKLLESDETSDNSYRVSEHFSRVAAEVESIKLGDLAFSTSNAEEYISKWDAFHDDDETSEYATFQELADAYWV